MKEIFYTISGAPDAMKKAFPKEKWFMRENNNLMLAFSQSGGKIRKIHDLWLAATSISGIKNLQEEVIIKTETIATCKELTIRIHESSKAMDEYIYSVQPSW